MTNSPDRRADLSYTASHIVPSANRGRHFGPSAVSRGRRPCASSSRSRPRGLPDPCGCGRRR
jgi:hypothetical protein